MKVSIVTPYQNSGVFFKKALHSVINQTHKDWEWIIIDDCSKEKESSYLEDLSKKEKRIKVIHNKTKKGPAYCRNLGIKNSTGDFIAFLDSDDFWSYEKLEKQLNFMLENNYGFSATFYNVFDEKSGKIVYRVKGPKKCSHKKFLILNYVGCLTVMYKREIYPDLSIPDDIEKRNDYALWLKISEKEPCHIMPEYLGTYVKHQDNSVSSVGKRKIIAYHRDMFMKLYGYSRFKATIYAYRNGFHFLIKEVIYKSKTKPTI